MVSSLRRVQVKISGLVQGVGFRFYIQRAAKQLRLTGYVRNEPDGSVLAEAQGLEAVLEEFQQQLQTGPSPASVAVVHVEWIDPVASEKEFVIRF